MSDEILKSAIEKYSNSFPLRAITTFLIPGGALFDLMATDLGSKISQQRFLKYLEELKIQLNDIDENTVNKEFLKSEEFYDVFSKAAKNAVQERFSVKIKAYALIVKESISGELTVNNFDSNDAERFIEIVSVLNPMDLKIAQVFYERHKAEVEAGRKPYIEVKDINVNITDEDKEISLLRLQAQSIIKVKTGIMDGGRSFVATVLLDKLVAFVLEKVNTDEVTL